MNKIYYKSSQDMSEVTENNVSLIVTSPPYWNIKDYSLDGYQKNKHSKKTDGQIGDIGDYEEYLDELDKVWAECYRTLKPNGKLCVNVPLMPILKRKSNTHYTRDIVNIASGIENHILKKTKFYLMDVYIWNRTNPSKSLMFGSYPYPPNFYAQNTIEFISVYVKDGETEKKTNAIKEQSKLTQGEWVEYTKQVWNIPIPNRSDVAYGEHPAIMPEEIARRLILLYSFVDDVVLDPFLGSGTTAKVAKELRRKCIGYEINKAYKNLIERKLGVETLTFKKTYFTSQMHEAKAIKAHRAVSQSQ